MEHGLTRNQYSCVDRLQLVVNVVTLPCPKRRDLKWYGRTVAARILCRQVHRNNFRRSPTAYNASSTNIQWPNSPIELIVITRR
jgi:hypothetical protein